MHAPIDLRTLRIDVILDEIYIIQSPITSYERLKARVREGLMSSSSNLMDYAQLRAMRAMISQRQKVQQSYNP